MIQAFRIDRSQEAAYGRDLARAFGGALLFTVPLLMTMEMWRFGLHLDRTRLALFVVTALPLLYGLAHYAGFSRHRGWLPDLLDTLVALAVGFLTAGILLLLLNVLNADATLDQTLGQVLLQAIPGAIGALLARRQLSGRDDSGEQDEDQASYPGELFLMVAGALFLALNVAPTEEILLIAVQTTPWHAVALLLLSLTLMHVIVFQVGFAGQEEAGQPVTAFFHFTLAGYGLVLLVSLFMLWIFGRTEGQALSEIVSMVVVLGFPASLGAAAARLLV
ncbi:TIGR02587 family membrane protein [Brevundimonas sp. A19_0]|uniref:TIGR02587 family membrane protein n=1 Tax=Brevundimonas sp. A19_0 TaxID=2821087 RepID=UPI001AD9C7F0|nr:TIGR02587 family membrane protein [Brevundimonas sp. A19_0]MBO9501991.1 TIGR02587 family membrane protein [Brevundimonas sp. A19_0]